MKNKISVNDGQYAYDVDQVLSFASELVLAFVDAPFDYKGSVCELCDVNRVISGHDKGTRAMVHDISDYRSACNYCACYCKGSCLIKIIHD